VSVEGGVGFRQRRRDERVGRWPHAEPDKFEEPGVDDVVLGVGAFLEPTGIAVVRVADAVLDPVVVLVVSPIAGMGEGPAGQAGAPGISGR
jgi:hypothetical protein